MQKLQKYKPRIAAFNGKCENLNFESFFFQQPSMWRIMIYLHFLLGIYEIFSKEVFGVKVKKLEFGLQPHKVPDTETVSSCKVISTLVKPTKPTYTSGELCPKCVWESEGVLFKQKRMGLGKYNPFLSHTFVGVYRFAFGSGVLLSAG